jgi:acetylornithine deacetylase
MKGAVAAMVAAMRAVAETGVAGRVVLSAVIGECDALGLGTSAALQRGLRADACLNGEPTELRILTDHAGVTQLDVTVSGREVHVYEREAGTNAIEKMQKLLARLDASILRREGGLDRLPILNVGTIHGGTWPSLTAAECSIGIDVRSTGGMSPDSILEDVGHVIATLEREDPGFSARAALRRAPQFIQQYPYRIDPDNDLVRLVAEAHHDVVGSTAEVGPHWPESFYGTDASHTSHAGIATVIYGPGSHAQISRPDERVALTELTAAATVYATVAHRFLSRAL